MLVNGLFVIASALSAVFNGTWLHRCRSQNSVWYDENSQDRLGIFVTLLEARFAISIE